MSNLDYNNDNILSNFPSYIRKNVEELCLRNRIGLSDITLSDISIIPNRIVNEENNIEQFHFLIKVPYAGKRLKWEMLFDPEDFDFAPDFDFNDDHFLENPDHDTIINNIPSLVNWNLKNPKILSEVLKEFLILYKKLQIEKLKQDNIYSYFYEEYESLIAGDNGIEPENVEIQVELNSINFLISIKIDFTALPTYLQPLLFRDAHFHSWYNPGEDFVHLKISIGKLDGSHTTTSLFLSPRLDQVLGGPKGLNLPEYKKDVSFLQYVAIVSNMVKNRVALIVEHYRMKKLFITTFVAMCNFSIIEYDTESFNKVVFLHKVEDYTCLVSVIIGQKFPQEKPTVTLSSIYCQEGKNCYELLDKYLYKMEDSPEENITILLKTLDEALLVFKNHKH